MSKSKRKPTRSARTLTPKDEEVGEKERVNTLARLAGDDGQEKRRRRMEGRISKQGVGRENKPGRSVAGLRRNGRAKGYQRK